MAIIVPFKGITACKEYANKIVTHSADSYSLEEVKKIIEQNPLSYLSVIYPDFIDGKKTSPHSLDRFGKIYQRFQLFRNKQYFVQDINPTYYIYKQKHKEFEFNGIIGAVSVNDYLNANIKVHEQTLKSREEKLKEYLKYCKINAEPVLIFYEKNNDIKNIIQQIQVQEAEIKIEIDGVIHSLWKTTDHKINHTIQEHFSKIRYMYIGDGHHRSSSSTLLAKEFTNIHHPDSINYFLGALFSEEELKIFSFHRVLKNIHIPENFIEQLSEALYLKEINNSTYSLSRGLFGMYWNGKKYILEPRLKSNNVLDVEILYQIIFKRIFFIEDIRNNQNIQYFPGYNYDTSDIEKLIDTKEYQIAFFTYPVSVEDIKNTALNNQIMPPKSTYVLPKLLNGLVIYSLENSI